jgi:hypothetical protein
MQKTSAIRAANEIQMLVSIYGWNTFFHSLELALALECPDWPEACRRFSTYVSAIQSTLDTLLPDAPGSHSPVGDDHG